MTELSDAITFNETRGYEDWSELDTSEQSAALAQAGDYILQHFQIRAELSDAEQLRYSTAKFLIARELASIPIALRAATAIKTKKSSLGSMSNEVTYFDAPADTFPAITVMLEPLVVGYRRTPYGIAFGRFTA
jgi:hypothetical protein